MQFSTAVDLESLLHGWMSEEAKLRKKAEKFTRRRLSKNLKSRSRFSPGIHSQFICRAHSSASTRHTRPTIQSAGDSRGPSASN